MWSKRGSREAIGIVLGWWYQYWRWSWVDVGFRYFGVESVGRNQDAFMTLAQALGADGPFAGWRLEEEQVGWELERQEFCAEVVILKKCLWDIQVKSQVGSAYSGRAEKSRHTFWDSLAHTWYSMSWNWLRLFVIIKALRSSYKTLSVAKGDWKGSAIEVGEWVTLFKGLIPLPNAAEKLNHEDREISVWIWPCGIGYLTSSFTVIWGWKPDWIRSREWEVNEDRLLRKFCCKVKHSSDGREVRSKIFKNIDEK